jgi:Ni/Co efflux regulator RcnB/surface antigen
MSRILTAALALSLLSSASVMAQPNYPNHPDRGDEHRVDQNRQDPSRDNQNRDNRDRNERDHDQDRRNEPGARQAVPRWSRGDHVPSQYRQKQYVVSDWRQHGLKSPPRGYVWVRNDYNDFFLAAISTGAVAQTVYRDDRDQRWRQRYSRTYTYNDDVYYRECRNSSDPAGVLVGALIGGLIGNAAGSGGGRTGATVAGVIVGGVVGAALTRNLDCEDRSYAYRSYYDAFNSGRPGSRYDWRNPRNDHRGQFRVGGYYNDPAGFRCATYTQTIYIQGRPQQASGRACRQPDGAWAIVR